MTRRIASLCLTLLLGFALAAGALAQGMAQGGANHGDLQQAVICVDGHEAIVLIDRNGQPVEEDAACPESGCADCLRLTVEILLPDASASADLIAVERQSGCVEGRRFVSIHLPRPLARAPPEEV